MQPTTGSTPHRERDAVPNLPAVLLLGLDELDPTTHVPSFSRWPVSVEPVGATAGMTLGLAHAANRLNRGGCEERVRTAHPGQSPGRGLESHPSTAPSGSRPARRASGQGCRDAHPIAPEPRARRVNHGSHAGRQLAHGAHGRPLQRGCHGRTRRSRQVSVNTRVSNFVRAGSGGKAPHQYHINTTSLRN